MQKGKKAKPNMVIKSFKIDKNLFEALKVKALEEHATMAYFVNKGLKIVLEEEKTN